MKCNNCNKTIPDVSITCPYCKNIIDPNAKSINFGDIHNTEYEDKDKFNIKVYVNEPINKIKIIGVVFSVILLICIIVFLIISSKKPDYIVFTNTVEKITMFLEDNYIGSKSSSSGKYSLMFSVNNTKIGFEGNYGYDVKNRIISLDGVLKNPNQETGDIVVSPKYFKYNLYMKYNNLYLQSNEIFDDNYILFELFDETGLLKTKKYDIYSLVIGESDALLSALKNMTYSKTKEKIVFRGSKITLDKTSLILDNKGKLKFITSFINSLLEDSNFINEYAKINGKSSDQVIKMLENYITTSEYKYSKDVSDFLEISIYSSKFNVHRIEIIDTLDDKKFILDIVDNKYYLDYFIGSKNILTSSLIYSFNEGESINEKKYIITFDTDKVVSDINLSLEEDKVSSIKKKNVDINKNIKDLTVDEIDYIKTKTRYYIDDVSFIDRIREHFKEKCNKDLTCVCEKNECDCTYNNKIIKCPIELVLEDKTDIVN